MGETIAICILVVAAGMAAAWHWQLFPNQWRCMYEEDDVKDGKCKKQCRMCRNFENN